MTTDEIFNAYAYRFGFPPNPMCVHRRKVAEVLKEALDKGEPVPEDYDWYGDLPPNTLA